MKAPRLTIGAVAVPLAAALLSACGSSANQSAPTHPVSGPLLTACTQLDGQPKEQIASQSRWTYFYDLPPSLADALRNSGNATLEALGRQLAVTGTDSVVMQSMPKAFDQGQSLCRSLIH
jgi:hypothetical protein